MVAAHSMEEEEDLGVTDQRTKTAFAARCYGVPGLPTSVVLSRSREEKKKERKNKLKNLPTETELGPGGVVTVTGMKVATSPAAFASEQHTSNPRISTQAFSVSLIFSVNPLPPPPIPPPPRPSTSPPYSPTPSHPPPPYPIPSHLHPLPSISSPCPISCSLEDDVPEDSSAQMDHMPPARGNRWNLLGVNRAQVLLGGARGGASHNSRKGPPVVGGDNTPPTPRANERTGRFSGRCRPWIIPFRRRIFRINHRNGSRVQKLNVLGAVCRKGLVVVVVVVVGWRGGWGWGGGWWVSEEDWTWERVLLSKRGM